MEHFKVPYVNLSKANKPYRKYCHNVFDNILETGDFILGSSLVDFENAVSAYLGVNYAVAVNSGTSALYLALKAHGVGPGDEVITVPNSYIATTSAIVLSGATPRFVDVGNDGNINPDLIENAINKYTKAVLPVHLSGIPCQMELIRRICKENRLQLIDDCSQAFGSEYRGRKLGSLSDASCFSLHPLKNLGLTGDGGIITTNNEQTAHILKSFRNLGHTNRDTCDHWSHNMRLDTLSAAIGLYKLKNLDTLINKRIKNANKYFSLLPSCVKKPIIDKQNRTTFHTYIINIKNRDHLKEYLFEKGIETKIHYPNLIYEQPAYLKHFGPHVPLENAELQKQSKLTLPIAEYLEQKQIVLVAEEVNKFCLTFDH